jgi:hypothetical protein
MTIILNSLIMLVGAWLAVSPFILGYTPASIGVCVVIGLFVIALAWISIKQKTAQWPAMITALLGFFLILWGAFLGHLAAALSGISEILVGILLAVFAVICLPFQLKVEKVDFYNRNGGGLATFNQIRIKNENILAKAVLLGSMPETIYMYPEEICKAIALMDVNVILSLPKILYLGWKRNRAKS